jgi:hypothetical protein
MHPGDGTFQGKCQEQGFALVQPRKDSRVFGVPLWTFFDLPLLLHEFALKFLLQCFIVKMLNYVVTICTPQTTSAYQ